MFHWSLRPRKDSDDDADWKYMQQAGHSTQK